MLTDKQIDRPATKNNTVYAKCYRYAGVDCW